MFRLQNKVERKEEEEVQTISSTDCCGNVTSLADKMDKLQALTKTQQEYQE